MMNAAKKKGTWGGWNRGKGRPAVRPQFERNSLLLENLDVVRWAVTRLLMCGRLRRRDEEDALSEGVLAGLRAAELWDEATYRVSFRGYLYSCVRQCLFERFPLLPFEFLPLQDFDLADERLEVQADDLPPWVRPLVTERHFRALELRFGRGWTFSEIGRAMGVQEHSAFILCKRALARLRKSLGVAA